MALVAKEEDLVLEQHLVDRTDCLIGQVARQLDVLISAPSRAARLTTSARGMTLSMVVAWVMIMLLRRDLGL